MGKENDRSCRGGDDCSNEEHLCKVEKRGDMELLRQLARDARFACRKCGRAAYNGKNLCRPEKL
jgi:hypothetical protein